MKPVREDESWRHSRSVYELPKTAERPRSVYVHVPFCSHRCGYCDFTLVADRDDLIVDYLNALSNELDQLNEVCAVDSIFVGGGTPTHLAPDQIEQLMGLISAHFELTCDGEYTFEANPDGLSSHQLDVLGSGGVNRLSLGVQSFDTGVLRTLERTHTAQQAQAAVVRAQQIIPNISLDLIFGVPGQSEHVWRQSLATATALPVRHVSTYGLTFEKGTDFYRRRLQEKFSLVSNECERLQYADAMSVLADAGLEQYEISNHAHPDARCRHNEVYWDASEYFAFGPGAARYVNGTRSTNARNVTGWIRSWLRNEPVLQEYERLCAIDRAREAVMLGLRRNQGIPQGQFRNRFGYSVSSLAPEALERHLTAGLLEQVSGINDVDEPDTWLRFTTEGRFVADTVVVDFL
ncbi:MAG: radical SAM family heme chaperone HemW [Fuerstiella sp.]|nr:radical SAM family heme chaperone HemW [Fuerstiella sp.]